MVEAFDKFSGGRGTGHWLRRGQLLTCGLVCLEQCRRLATEGGTPPAIQDNRECYQSLVFGCGRDSCVIMIERTMGLK